MNDIVYDTMSLRYDEVERTIIMIPIIWEKMDDKEEEE